MLDGTQTQDDHALDAWREQVERAWNCEVRVGASAEEQLGCRVKARRCS